MVIAILPWFLLLLFLIAAAIVIRARRKAVGHGYGDLPRCAKCGYPTIDLSTTLCPECGSDLLENGVLSPGMTRSGWTGWGLFFLWSLIMLVFGLVLCILLASTIIPTVVRGTLNCELDRPSSGAYQKIELNQTGAVLRWPAQMGSGRPAKLGVWVTLVCNDGSTSTVYVNASNSAYKIVHPAKMRKQYHQPFNHSAVAQWFAKLGINARVPDVSHEIDVMLGQQGLTGYRMFAGAGPVSNSGNSYSSGGWMGFGAGGSGVSSSSSGPLEWPVALVVLLLVIVWAYGVWRIVRQPAKGAGSTPN